MSLVDRHDQIIDKCVDSLKIWTELIANHLDGEDKNAELEKLKRVTKDYCELDEEFQKSMRVLKKVEERLDGEGPTKDVKQLYNALLEEDTEEECKDFTDTDIWQKVFVDASDVIEIKRKEDTIDESNFEELGDSLLCSNVFTPPIDPISKAVIRNPYKSKKCKHVYEYSTIVSYIKQQKRRAKCPYIGCRSTQLLMSDLVEDGQLQTQITQYIETQNGEDEDDED